MIVASLFNVTTTGPSFGAFAIVAVTLAVPLPSSTARSTRLIAVSVSFSVTSVLTLVSPATARFSSAPAVPAFASTADAMLFVIASVTYSSSVGAATSTLPLASPAAIVIDSPFASVTVMALFATPPVNVAVYVIVPSSATVSVALNDTFVVSVVSKTLAVALPFQIKKFSNPPPLASEIVALIENASLSAVSTVSITNVPVVSPS